MAIAFDAASSVSGTNVSSLSWSHATASLTNGIVIVTGGGYNWAAWSVSNCTYDAVGITKKFDYVRPSGDKDHITAWYKVAPAAGSKQIVLSFSATLETAAAGAVTLSGVDQSTPLDTAATAAGSSGNPTVAVSSATDDLVFDIVLVSYGSGGTITPDASQTQRWEKESIGAYSYGCSTKPGAASVTMTWTQSGGLWIIGGCSINPAAAAGPPVGGMFLTFP